jgi:predicted RNA binding protein YcfA (HicA-like mRNA interferase family)
MPSPVRFGAVVKMLKRKGFSFDHVKGSHHICKHSEGRAFTVPVHKNQGKFIYFKQIEKL